MNWVEPSWAIMNQDDPGWTEMNHAEPKWTRLNHNEPRWSRKNRDELRWTELDNNELGWCRMNRDEPGWTELNRDEPGWSRMNRDEPGWTKLNHVEPYMQICLYICITKWLLIICMDMTSYMEHLPSSVEYERNRWRLSSLLNKTCWRLYMQGVTETSNCVCQSTDSTISIITFTNKSKQVGRQH